MDRDCVLLIFILTRLSGAQDISTVRSVSVQSGQSIIIPCLYKQKSVSPLWRDHVTSSDRRATVISEDSWKILAVHMDDVRESAQFSCPAHFPPGADEQEHFSLEVTPDSPRLSVGRQSESAPESGSVSVSCVHRGETPVRWCKFAGSCVTEASGTLDGASVEIRHEENRMTVKMSKLSMKNAGWYLCSTPQLQMPVHITVHNHTEETTARKRTAVLFLLPVMVETLLIVIICSGLKLLTLLKERFLKPVNPAEEGQYVMMHRKRSSHPRVCSEEAYEIMAELTANTEATPGMEESTDSLESSSSLKPQQAGARCSRTVERRPVSLL